LLQLFPGPLKEVRPSKWRSPKTLDFQGPLLSVALEKDILRRNAAKRIMFKNVEEMYRRLLFKIVSEKFTNLQILRWNVIMRNVSECKGNCLTKMLVGKSLRNQDGRLKRAMFLSSV
jgi:hypothetical protein